MNETHVGFSATCANSLQAGEDCVESELVGMVRSLQCGPGETGSCDVLFVGGYFDTALGVEARGVVRLDLSDYDEPAVLPVGDELGSGVDGLVMTVTALSGSEVVFGGIYDDPSESDVPYLLNRWTEDKGARCVLNRNMINEDVCAVDVPPLLCCELIFGPVYTTLQVRAAIQAKRAEEQLETAISAEGSGQLLSERDGARAGADSRRRNISGGGGVRDNF
jgi:hypothetical protein